MKKIAKTCSTKTGLGNNITLLIVSILSNSNGLFSDSIFINNVFIYSFISDLFDFDFDVSLSVLSFSNNTGLGSCSPSTSSKSIALSLEYFLYNFFTILLRLLIDLQIFFLLLAQAVLTSFDDLHDVKESFSVSSSVSFLKKLKL